MASFGTKLVSDDGCYISRKIFADPELYQLEKQHIFGRNWIYMGHESQLVNSGDFITSFIGETPVIVARGEDHNIHVSFNSCVHRGVKVCRADQGNAKRFVCPYHNWSYTVDGRLVAVPQERKVEGKLDKSMLGLKKVPRVETYRELIFACLNPEIEPLDEYLGDMRWYLDCMFDRFEDGVEVLGAPHKWLIKANWKLPVENQLGDVGHGPYLHGSIITADAPQVEELETYGRNVVPKPGHGVAVRLMPEGSTLAQCMWGSDGFAAMDPEVNEYLLEKQRLVEERLGTVRARIKPLTYSVYPNFSFLWPNLTLRQSHPKGPGAVEYWSWYIVDKGAPDHIKIKLESNYNFFFGPGGVLEQEDAEAWSQQYIGSVIDYADDTPYFYGLGLGEAKPHAELPGMVGSCFDEHYARAFYQRWQEEIQQGEAGA